MPLPKALTMPSTTCDETVEKVVLNFVATPFTTLIMAAQCQRRYRSPILACASAQWPMVVV